MSNVEPALPPSVVKVEFGDPRYCQLDHWHDAHEYRYELPEGVTGRYECHGAPWPVEPAPGSCPGTGSTHNFDVAGRELSVLGCWDCDAQWRLVPYRPAPPVEPSTDTADTIEGIVTAWFTEVGYLSSERHSLVAALREHHQAAVAARDAAPMVQVGWFSHNIFISMSDMASVRAATIRENAVPVYADAADAKHFAPPGTTERETT